jgi:hypothetical protein
MIQRTMRERTRRWVRAVGRVADATEAATIDDTLVIGHHSATYAASSDTLTASVHRSG